MGVSDRTPNREFVVRQARADDEAAVVSFTRDTWGDRHGDYLPDVFGHWVETDGPDQRTFVIDVDDGDDVAGVIQGAMLTDTEAWAQGMRVNPDYRGEGLSPSLSAALMDWARERGAAVCRNMVFSWNVAGLGQSRAVGFRPATEFRWAQPDPDPDATPKGGGTPDVEVTADPAAAWAWWTDSDARTHLRGLAMDANESWACSELRREQLRAAAEDDRLFVARDEGGTRGFSYRAYDYERETDDGEVETWGIYGVGAWETPAAAGAILRAVARDAGEAGLDNTRVLIPEGARWVSDVAAARFPVSGEPDFVMSADLTDPATVLD
ncbi:GNAT family N-acetyltransferase [Halorarum halobium]|uniref:GNAT family N-acetyltransferase n=1 Tax=Halorarum halobium TaxID=3075121 RepID=UPI0028AFC9F3|nr:GNAT family N-acetyltransferase [Halobaculum sp. XH14]